VLHPTTTVLDDGTLDCFQFVWNLWWFRTSVVDLHTNPFFTRYLFHPDAYRCLPHVLGLRSGSRASRSSCAPGRRGSRRTTVCS